MAITIFAFESSIGAMVRSAQNCTKEYPENALEPTSQVESPQNLFRGAGLWAKSHLSKRALLALGKGGA